MKIVKKKEKTKIIQKKMMCEKNLIEIEIEKVYMNIDLRE